MRCGRGEPAGQVTKAVKVCSNAVTRLFPGSVMTEISKEEGIAYTVLERFEKFRLPRALDIKERVDRGERLSDADIAFLDRVMSDAEEINRLVDMRPEFTLLYGRAVNLYQEITKKALENEQKP